MLKKISLILILATTAIILFHNVSTYPITAGTDYWKRAIYAQIISHEFRFPTYQESSEVYDAPLFYFVSGWLGRAIGTTTGLPLADSLGLVRLVPATFALISFWLWYKIFSGFYPKNKFGAVTFILLLTSMPVFYKAGAMYVSELLNLFLATLSFYWFIHHWLKAPHLKNTLWLSLIIILGLLTRVTYVAVAMALIIAILVYFWANKNFINALKPITIIAILSFVGVGWFYFGRYQKTPLNIGYNLEDFEAKTQNLGFYFYIPVKVMLTYPFRPILSEPSYLLPIYFADFWGDYWNYFPQTRFGNNELIAARGNRQAFSTARKVYLAWQSRINLLPTLLIIVSFWWLVIDRLRRILKKQLNFIILGEFTLLTTVIITWASLYVLAAKYPGQGDLIKATYTSFIAPIYVYAEAVFLFRILKRVRIIFWPALTLLVIAAINNFIFSWF